jgi:hypothetical protein
MKFKWPVAEANKLDEALTRNLGPNTTITLIRWFDGEQGHIDIMFDAHLPQEELIDLFTRAQGVIDKTIDMLKEGAIPACNPPH